MIAIAAPEGDNQTPKIPDQLECLSFLQNDKFFNEEQKVKQIFDDKCQRHYSKYMVSDHLEQEVYFTDKNVERQYNKDEKNVFKLIGTMIASKLN